MTTFRNKVLPGFALAGLALTLGGCGDSTVAPAQPKAQAAEITIWVDASASTPFIGSPTYADAAIKRAGQAVVQQKLGDSVRIVRFGERTVDSTVNMFSERSGYNNRLPAMRQHVETALRELMERNRKSGGEGATNIVFSLENTHPICTPGSVVKIFSDGIAEDENFSVTKALALGQKVHLPPPAAPFLKGCQVEMIGIGVASMGAGSGSILDNEQAQRLIAGWREYFAAAGVRPQDMTFTSSL